MQLLMRSGNHSLFALKNKLLTGQLLLALKLQRGLCGVQTDWLVYRCVTSELHVIPSWTGANEIAQ